MQNDLMGGSFKNFIGLLRAHYGLYFYFRINIKDSATEIVLK